MYIRSKVANGRTYYQIVDGIRRGSVVCQRVLVPLGTTPDPAVALEDMRRELAEIRAGYVRGTLRSNQRMERAYRRMDRLETKIRDLSHIMEHKLLGAPPRRCTWSVHGRAVHEAGHAVARFLARCKIEYVTIDANPADRSGGHVLLKQGLKHIKRPEQLQGCSRTRRRLLRDLEFLCAGSAAEALNDPKRRDEDHEWPLRISGSEESGDWHDAKRLLDGAGLDKDETYLQIFCAYDRVKAKLKKPEVWTQVEALAEQLIEHRRLGGDYARYICGMARRKYRESLRRSRQARPVSP